MIKIDAKGENCPIPVIKTKKALKNLGDNNGVETLVDNEASMENLLKLAKEMGMEATWKKLGKYQYKVTIMRKLIIDNGESIIKEESLSQERENKEENMVIVIASDKMGEGIDELGEVLIKGFIYTLTEMETLPKTIVFYNGGAKLTVEDAPTLEDLKLLEKEGVEILTCGTCLNYYHLEDKLRVGEVTNMYTILERLQKATKIIRP
jgi:selenium metabolism protein YedF